MKNSVFKKIGCVLCCAALLLSLAACSKQTGASADPTPAPEATARPEATPAPEDGASPTPAPEGTDAEPTPAPEGGTSSTTEHTSVLPAPESGSDDFRKAFEENPIDAQYAEDLELAASMAAIIAASNTASESWQAQIDSVYKQILERGDEETVEQAKEAQSHWVNEQSDALKAIRDAVSEDDAMAAVTVAENIMLYYRTRAIDLCAVLYEIDGKLVFG